MRRRAVLAVAVTVVVGAAGAAVVVTRLAAAGRSVQAPVSRRGGGSVALGGARLSVPPGAVSGNGRLVASSGGGSVPGGGPGTGLALAGGSTPVRFQVTGARVTGPLKVTFRVGSAVLPPGLHASGDAGAVWLAYYDATARQWRPAASRYDAAAGTVTALVSHLSWWAPWTWDWQGFALRLRQSLSAFGSGRAPAVSCPAVPEVTVTSAGGQDPPLIGCAAKSGTDALAITITNNRGVSMVVSAAPPDATQGRPSYQGFDEYVATRDGVAHALGGTDLPPSETLTYSLPLHGPSAVFAAAPTLGSYALDLAAAAGDALLGAAEFGKVSGDYASCVLAAVARSQPASIADAPGLVVQCLPALVQAVPALKGLGGPVVQLLIADTRLILQDFDLAHDAIRGVAGRANIARPNSPALVDWRNTTYTTTCGGWTRHPVTVTVRNGSGKYVVTDQPYQSYLELRVIAVAQGDLTGAGSSQTAVLLLCLPYPTNFFVTETQLFTSAGQAFGPALYAPNILNAYPPYFDGHPFTISNGVLKTGAGYYPSCHACGTVQYLLTWKWNGSQLKLQTATKTSDQPAPLG